MNTGHIIFIWYKCLCLFRLKPQLEELLNKSLRPEDKYKKH